MNVGKRRPVAQSPGNRQRVRRVRDPSGLLDLRHDCRHNRRLIGTKKSGSTCWITANRNAPLAQYSEKDLTRGTNLLPIAKCQRTANLLVRKVVMTGLSNVARDF